MIWDHPAADRRVWKVKIAKLGASCLDPVELKPGRLHKTRRQHNVLSDRRLRHSQIFCDRIFVTDNILKLSKGINQSKLVEFKEASP
ncbi:hypothetical protein D3C77_402390 [compost metagenome]